MWGSWSAYDFFDFCVGAHHEVLAPEKNREHGIGDQVVTLNAGLMEHLRRDGLTRSRNSRR